MPDDPSAPQPTPTNYQRTTGGSHLRWVPPTPEHLQEMLPAYEILSILGQGGMGAVYKGRQKSLDRVVAIKILPPEAGEDDMQFVERFKNEARTMAKMNHPAIVHVYDFGETTEGQLYIVMEFIDGTDVAKMIQEKKKLPEDYALSITAHVCDALGYAHTQGVVHRDIKPANVLINQQGQVKVADFGLAKATDPSQMGLTKTNMAMGTPDFVSPEALMPGVPLDGRADLYAVGVMLFNMLTGTIPRGAFRMPSVTHQTDARFDKIIGKAMEMDRELRYQTALELRRDLDVILTTPAAKTGMQTIPAQAAVAPQSMPQKPVGKSPSAPQQQKPAPSTGVPPSSTKPPQGAAKPASGKVAPAPASKSNAGMIYGIAAAVVVGTGAFFMFSGSEKKPAAAPKTVAEASPNRHRLPHARRRL
jgi:serine/threonine protein kinase